MKPITKMTKPELIKCPKCGKEEITITGTFKIYRHWSQQDGQVPVFYDYEDGDYEPIDDYPPEFTCNSCGHAWLGDSPIDDYLADE